MPCGAIVGSYGSYRHSDEGIYSDGVMLVALAVLAVLWLLIAITKCHLSRQVVRRIAFASIILEAFSLTMAGALVIGPPEMNVAGNHFLASTFCTLGGLACMSYWLRRARDCTAITAVIYSFGALFVSELLIFTSIFMENGISYFYAAVLVLLQFPCMLLARTKPLACDIKTLSNKGDFFNFTKNTMTSKVFLATICVSIGVLACADGFLRGYPDGLPIAFRATTRFADLVLILAFCVAIIVFTCRQHHRVMTVGIFVTMEALACIALLCYSAWPDALDIGAIFTTNLNALLVGFSWYIILAFMSYGWRCPYYYAIAGWIVWLGCRGIARITLINVTAVSQNDLLMLAAVFTMVVISTQVAFVNFLNVRKFEAVPEEELTHQQKAVQTSPVVKVLGSTTIMRAWQTCGRPPCATTPKRSASNSCFPSVRSRYFRFTRSAGRKSAWRRSYSSARGPLMRTSSASTRKLACTHARKSSITWKSTHPKVSNSEVRSWMRRDAQSRIVSLGGAQNLRQSARKARNLKATPKEHRAERPGNKKGGSRLRTGTPRTALDRKP